MYLLFCRMLAFTFTAEQCSRVLSIIIDAMSKWKTSIPHWRRIPKGLDGQGTVLNFPLTCSNVHGFANIAISHLPDSYVEKGLAPTPCAVYY